MRTTFCDPALQAELTRTGYAVVPMLSCADVDALLASVDRLHPADNFDPANSSRSAVTYHCSFLDADLAYKRQALALIETVFAPFLNRYLAGYRVLSGNFYVKPPGTGEFQIHQNWPCIADPADTTVTIWCPLVDVVESNGAVQVIPGSHKIVPHVEAPGAPAFFSAITDVLIAQYLNPVPMTAGQGLIFDDNLIHWSARNSSSTARIAIQITCIPVDATPTFFFRDSDRRFELIAADTDFYLEQGFADLLVRRPQWRSMGFVPNRNHLVDAVEFAALMRRSAQIRADVYAGCGFPGPQPTGRLRRLSAMVGR